jgi:uncharacterized protein
MQLEENIQCHDSTTTQIVVITIESLQNEDVSSYQSSQTWELRNSLKTTMVVIGSLVAKRKKIAINPGYGLAPINSWN